MTPPRQAVILAAGYGSRLAPLTHTLPKCLLPIWGNSILHGLLTRLASWGVRDVLVNMHHAPTPLFDALRQAASRGPLRITCSHEPEILGTGGALQRARWFFGSRPFWMVNGDVVFETSPRPFLRAMARHDALAVLMMTRAGGPRTVELAPDGEVLNFRSTTPGAPDTCTFCGLQLIDPRLLGHLPDTPFSSIIDAYHRAQSAGAHILGVVPSRSFWMDIGTPEGLLAAHAQTLAARMSGAPGASFAASAPRRAGSGTTFRALGAGVRVARGAVLRNVIALPGAEIRAGARLHNVIIGPGVVAEGRLDRLAVRLDQAGDPGALAATHDLGWPVPRTVVQPLSPRGSNRTYLRLSAGRLNAILVRYSLERPENGRFTGHARFLADLGLRVPRILFDRPEDCQFVMTDLGNYDLLDAATGLGPAARRRLYEPVVRAVADWHRLAGPAARRRRLRLEPAFTSKLFAWEHQLFRDHYLVGRLALRPADIAPALDELRGIARRLRRMAYTVVHRDLQSTNILLTPDGPAFIDFQGMRWGPAVYDVASLLADPYVSLDPATQRDLLQVYRDAVSADGAPPADLPDSSFWLAAIQRLVQALGAYGRLSRLPGMGGFTRHIRPAIEMLDRALSHGYNAPRMCSLTARMRAMEEQRS